MKTICAAFLLLLVRAGANGQVFPTASTSAQSASGQFFVTAPRQINASRPAAYHLSTNASLVRLEPTVVAISAERVRQAVWRELGVTGKWRHKINSARQ